MRVSKKLSRRIQEKGRISVNIEKLKIPGEYREKVEFVRVSKNCPDKYQKMVESM